MLSFTFLSKFASEVKKMNGEKTTWWPCQVPPPPLPWFHLSYICQILGARPDLACELTIQTSLSGSSSNFPSTNLSQLIQHLAIGAPLPSRSLWLNRSLGLGQGKSYFLYEPPAGGIHLENSFFLTYLHLCHEQCLVASNFFFFFLYVSVLSLPLQTSALGTLLPCS